MADVSAKQKMKQTSIGAVVIRADGTKEDLGTISYWHRNPLRRLWWKLTSKKQERKES